VLLLAITAFAQNNRVLPKHAEINTRHWRRTGTSRTSTPAKWRLT